jgi:orotate phosphoribosyltransferase
VSDVFVELMIESGVLAFGDFTLKSGRASPYFFNLGRIAAGSGLTELGVAYAATLVARGELPDVLFGPAYKGIPLAVTAALALHRDHAVDVGVAFNRKEAKDHGEGGVLVGAPLDGRVTIVDDDLVRRAGRRLHSVVVALDRQEQIEPGVTAVQRLASSLGVPVYAIATLQDVISYLDSTSNYADALANIRAYQRSYCVMPGSDDDRC